VGRIVYHIRNLTLLSAFVLALAVPSSSLVWGQTPASFFGMNTGRILATDPWPSVQLGSIRLWDTATTWSDLEPSRGTYNWTILDQYLTLAQAHNVEVLYTFGVTPNWAASQTSSTCIYGLGACYPPANMTDWDNFVTAIVNHAAGKIKYWEVWNEANAAGWYSGDIPTLVTMAEHAYRIIKAADPNAIVLTPSSTGAAAVVETFLTSYFAAGGVHYADGVAFHGYVGHIPEGILYLETKIRLATAAAGVGSMPLYNTEGSWGTDSSLSPSTDDPGYVARYLMLQVSSGVQNVFWYEWSSATWGTLWSSAGGLQPAGTAYAQVYSWLKGASLNNSCVEASDSTWTCTLTRSDGYQAIAVWNATTTKSYKPAGQYKYYRDLTGKTTAISGGSVPIGYAPILLVSTPPLSAPLDLTATVNN
jgi:polysaccharide biosynthesis protein PslG